jgi:hypothetical protein
MSRNTGIIKTGAVPAISLGAAPEDIANEEDFSAVFSRPEFYVL